MRRRLLRLPERFAPLAHGVIQTAITTAVAAGGRWNA
jgi:hypothetical protein